MHQSRGWRVIPVHAGTIRMVAPLLTFQLGMPHTNAQVSKPVPGRLLLGQPFSFPFEISQSLDELIRKIDAVKSNREIVDSLEIPVLAKVAGKIILYDIHMLHLLFR